jgi:uncharacterized protein (TIGR02687 family)
MKRIHDSLRRVCEQNRIVFWYDATGEWAQTFDAFADDTISKLKVMGNELGTKVRIVREPNPEARFLVYVPTVRPADADNWLLDLLLQAYEYKADKASLALQEVGLPHEFHHLAEEHAAFFRSEKRIQALKEQIHKEDQDREIRLKMMAILAGTAVEVDAMLLHFLSTTAETELFDPVTESFDSAGLVTYFWREVERVFGYTSATPSLRDFAVSLFRGANPLDPATLHQHARVFLQRWKDSQAYSASFALWSRRMEQDLQIAVALDSADDKATLGDSDTFELFEKFTLHKLCQAFQKGATAVELRAAIQKRRSSFWQTQHQDGYAALDHAVELRELLASVELKVDSVATGVSRYLTSWWRIDMAYRRGMLHLRRYGQIQVMGQIAQWMEKAYVNNFLLPLNDRWSDHVCRLAEWECEGLAPQRSFFDTYVKPFLNKGQKVFIIISDAFRYEAAAEFAQRLRSANRWTAEVDSLFGSLPSYTQLGMASLLPGKRWGVDGKTGNVTLDGRSASGTMNRSEILHGACDARATALQAEEFLELNSKTDGRALMRDNEVIYIFHNHIDKVGDAAYTEAKTFDAVEQTFDELESIIKKVANINGSNMLITSDHGFLFQQDDIDDNDMTKLPGAEEWTYRGQRFAFGKGITPDTKIKIFSSASLGLDGDWSAAFPLSLSRLPIPGAGKRYVHGGMSLQEILVPVIRVHKARTDDTGKVEVELTRVPSKITTGQISISLFQDKPAIDKVLPRILRIGIFAKDGTVLSEIKTQSFDSKETEARLRETPVLLTLSHAADAFNNRDVDIRLEETVPGTSQIVTYKIHSIRLQKPFASDFDEF